MTYWQDLQSLMNQLACTSGHEDMEYEELNDILLEKFRQLRRDKKRVYFVGNGGSAGIATHMVSDFLKNGQMRTGDLYGASTITCLSNDFGYKYVFSHQIRMQVDHGDMLVAISSSGRSPNILQAVHVAREMECQVLTLSGFQPDNPLRELGDWNIYVPSSSYGMVESIHNAILQRIVDEL